MIRVDAGSLRSLIADLGKLPPEVVKELRPRLRRAGEVVKRDAQAQASWSSRIPRAMRLTTRFASAKSAGVFITVNEAQAPHARPYEGIGTRGTTFRHPVFGDRDVWVAQAQRPFLLPAVQRNREAVVKASGEAVDAAARRFGFR